MQTTPSTHRALLVPTLAFAALAALGVAACDDGGGVSSPPHATLRPEQVRIAPDDPVVGRGLPAEFRVTGLEHNRITLVALRTLRGESRGFADPVRRCAAIRRVILAEAGRTAAVVGRPQEAALVALASEEAIAGLPGCGGARRTAAPGTAASSEGEETVPISDAAFAVMDRMLAAVGSAGGLAEVERALAEATAAAASFGETDAAAIHASIAQMQGSYALWQPGGAGWEELGMPIEYQLRGGGPGGAAALDRDDLHAIVRILAADGVACVGALKFIKYFPVGANPKVLVAACAVGAAGGSVWQAYKEYFDEE